MEGDCQVYSVDQNVSVHKLTRRFFRLSAQNPQKHRIGAELESPIKPSTPYSPNSLRTPPTVKFSAEMDMESLRKSEDV